MLFPVALRVPQVTLSMSSFDREQRERHFVEEMGLLFDASGGTRMAGRIIGRLLICEPPAQSSSQLAEYLGASAGAISVATRQVVQMGMVVRMPVPGSRAAWFAIPKDGIERHMLQDLARLRLFRELLQRGEALLQGSPAASRARIEELLDLYLFMERELPLLIERWRAQRPA